MIDELRKTWKEVVVAESRYMALASRDGGKQ
jgi:hypothetical protein